MTIVPVETMVLDESSLESSSNASEGPALALGSEVGGYQLLRRLGRGGQGEVYEARSLHKGEYSETVAIKIAPAGGRGNAQPSVLAEARRLMGIRHPGIVRMIGAGRSKGWHYCVMERIQGIPLRTLLTKSKGIPRSVSLEIAIKICDALKYLHGHHRQSPIQALLHRDLKPGNVMVNGFGEVKLIDFGISCPIHQIHWTSGPSYGTPAYMAPEQLTHSPQGPTTDLFALGVILYEMMTGMRMFSEGSAAKLLAKRIANRSHRGRALEKSTGCRLMDRVIARSVAGDPSDRYESATLLGRVLNMAANHRAPGPSLEEFFVSEGL